MLIEFDPQPVTAADIEKARRMTPGERISEGFRLTELAFQKQRDRVRRENPGAGEDEITRLCKVEMDEYRRTREAGIYVDVPRLRLGRGMRGVAQAFSERPLG